MRKALSISIASLALAVIAPRAASAEVQDYFSDRLYDVLDVFRLRGGAPNNGKAIGLKARATTLAQAGYVFFDGTYVGMDRRSIGIVGERRREAGLSAVYGSWNKMQPVWGNDFLMGDTEWHMAADRRLVRNLPHWDDGRQRHLSLGAEVATPLFGIDLGVYPEEALDLALGLFTIDIFRDDELWGLDTPYTEPSRLPVPNPAAPFAEKQQRLDEQMVRLAQAEMAAKEQGTPGAPQAVPALPPSPEVWNEVPPADTTPAPFEPLIEQKEADAAIEKLDARPLEHAPVMMDQPSAAPAPQESAADE